MTTACSTKLAGPASSRGGALTHGREIHDPTAVPFGKRHDVDGLVTATDPEHQSGTAGAGLQRSTGAVDRDRRTVGGPLGSQSNRGLCLVAHRPDQPYRHRGRDRSETLSSAARATASSLASVRSLSRTLPRTPSSSRIGGGAVAQQPFDGLIVHLQGTIRPGSVWVDSGSADSASPSSSMRRAEAVLDVLLHCPQVLAGHAQLFSRLPLRDRLGVAKPMNCLHVVGQPGDVLLHDAENPGVLPECRLRRAVRGRQA